MPDDYSVNNATFDSVLQVHEAVKERNKPNFLQAQIPITSQLKIQEWEHELGEYWDQQLLQLIHFGFPLDFNRLCSLGQYTGNHTSATEYPQDIEAYIAEELSFDALVGPFEKHPISQGHCSPFMTRNKPNAGIDKTLYIDSEFSLTFPTVDYITAELKCLGRGANLYKVDVSTAFCHVRVDPGDYDLLGLYWQGFYVDASVLFGTRHGSQIFQRLSDTVHYMMRLRGFTILDYNILIMSPWASQALGVRGTLHC